MAGGTCPFRSQPIMLQSITKVQIKHHWNGFPVAPTRAVDQSFIDGQRSGVFKACVNGSVNKLTRINNSGDGRKPGGTHFLFFVFTVFGPHAHVYRFCPRSATSNVDRRALVLVCVTYSDLPRQHNKVIDKPSNIIEWACVIIPFTLSE